MSISKSERFKIKVSGLPRFYSLHDPLLKEFLAMINSELRLECVHARFTKKGNAWLYLSFESEACQLRALNALRRYTWRGRTLISTLVTADPVKTRTETPYYEEDFSRKSQLNVSAMEQVLMSTIPYHSIGYEEQLRKKSEEVLGLFKRFHNILKSKLFPHPPFGGPPAAYYHQHIDPFPTRVQDGRLKGLSSRESEKVRLQDCSSTRDSVCRSSKGVESSTASRLQSIVQRVRSHDSGESSCSQPTAGKALLHESDRGSTSLLACWYKERFEKQNQESATSAKSGSNRFPFTVEKVRGSPIVDEYRNKAEFTVGINPDTNTLSVGPRIKSDPAGRVQVGPVEGLRHLPAHVIRCVKEFEQFVRTSGGDQMAGVDRTQIWKSIIIRTNYRRELMLILIADMQDASSLECGHSCQAQASEGLENPSPVGVPSSERISGTCVAQHTGTCVAQQKTKVVEFFTAEERRESLNIVSMYFQQHKDRSALSFSKSDLIWGREFFLERLLDLEIAIAGGSYFRINSEAARVLSEAILELSHVTRETTVLDLFCGSGSIALSLAKHCKEVIGIELLEQNVVDANRSAQLNGIDNCTFIGGKLEELLPGVLENLKTEDVVIILDPPRTGIIPELVRMLKRFRHAQRLIYICSDHKLPIKNLLDFCCNDVDVTERRSLQAGNREMGADEIERQNLGRSFLWKEVISSTKKRSHAKGEENNKKAERVHDRMSLLTLQEKLDKLSGRKISCTIIEKRADSKTDTKEKGREGIVKAGEENIGSRDGIPFEMSNSMQQQQIKLMTKRQTRETISTKHDGLDKNISSDQTNLDSTQKTVESYVMSSRIDEDETVNRTDEQKHSRNVHKGVKSKIYQGNYEERIADSYGERGFFCTESSRNTESIIIPEHIIPVDLSPHTLRTELVILCKRYEKSEAKTVNETVMTTSCIEKPIVIYTNRGEKDINDQKEFQDKFSDAFETKRELNIKSNSLERVGYRINADEEPEIKRAKLNEKNRVSQKVKHEDETRLNYNEEYKIPRNFQVTYDAMQVMDSAREHDEKDNRRNINTNDTPNNIKIEISTSQTNRPTCRGKNQQEIKCTQTNPTETVSQFYGEIDTNSDSRKKDKTEALKLMGIRDSKQGIDNGIVILLPTRLPMQLENIENTKVKMICEEIRDNFNDEGKSGKLCLKRGHWEDTGKGRDESEDIEGGIDRSEDGGKADGNLEFKEESKHRRPFSLENWLNASSRRAERRVATATESKGTEKTVISNENTLQDVPPKIVELTESKGESCEPDLDPAKLVQHLTQTERGSWFLAKIMNDCENRGLHQGSLDCLKYIHPDAVKEIETRAFVRGLAMGVEYFEEIRELMQD